MALRSEVGRQRLNRYNRPMTTEYTVIHPVRAKDPIAVELGRRGGKIGGTACVPKGFSMMTPERRKEAAAKAQVTRKKNIAARAEKS